MPTPLRTASRSSWGSVGKVKGTSMSFHSPISDRGLVHPLGALNPAVERTRYPVFGQVVDVGKMPVVKEDGRVSRLADINLAHVAGGEVIDRRSGR